MPQCIFCGDRDDVVLWSLEDLLDHPVPACPSCAKAHGLEVRSPVAAPDLPEHEGCQCCGRELPGRGCPVTVWVQDRRRLIAVCPACRAEYALQAVFTTTAPADRS